MFLIKVITKLPPNNVLNEVIALLSSYKVQHHSLYRSEGLGIVETIVVDQETRKGDLRLAELAFQMNYDQKDNCNHLTFITS